MPQIDRFRITQQAQTVFQNAGETATLRRFASANVGAPRFGSGNPTPSFTNYTITGLFWNRQEIVESYQGGGITTHGGKMLSTTFELQQSDEIYWRGSAYRIDGSITPQNLGGRMQYYAPLVLGMRQGG